MKRCKKLVKLVKWNKLLIGVIIVTLIWSISIGLSAIPTLSLDYTEYDVQLEPQLETPRLSYLRRLSNVGLNKRSWNQDSLLRRSSKNLKNNMNKNVLRNSRQLSDLPHSVTTVRTTSTKRRKDKKKRPLLKKGRPNRQMIYDGSGDIPNGDIPSQTTYAPVTDSVLNSATVAVVDDTSSVISVVASPNTLETSAFESKDDQYDDMTTNASDTVLQTTTQITSDSTVEHTTITSTTPAISTCRIEIPELTIPKWRFKSDSFRIKWTPLSKLNASFIMYKKTESYSETIKNITKDSFDDIATPCTNYTVCIKAYYSGCGFSSENCSSFVTPPGKPPKVEQLNATCDKRMAYVEWVVPSEECSDMKNIIIKVMDKDDDNVVENSTEISSPFMNVTNLKPYSSYIFEVSVKGNDDISEPETTGCRTLPDKPSKVVTPRLTTQAVDYTSITWDAPSEQNGELETYRIDFEGKTYNDTDNTCHFINKTFNTTDRNFNFNNLCGDSNYTLIIQAKNKDVADFGLKEYFPFSLEAGPPDCQSSSVSQSNTLDNVHHLTIQLNPLNKKTELKVEFDNFLCSNKNGIITHFDIIISDSKLANNDVDPNNTWYKSQLESELHPYFTTPIDWNPFQGELFTEEGSFKTVTFVVGNDGDCESRSPEDRCNGPLRPGTNYSIKIRAYTSRSHADSIILYVATEPDETHLIIIIIISILLILVMAVAVFFILKRKNIFNLRYYKKFDCLTTEPDDSNRPIPIRATSKPILLSDFEEHYKSMSADASLKFSMEFEELSYVSPKCPANVAQREENRPKNRWVNILPFDHSRVKLLPIADDASTDYINANYIPGYKSQREYIASQGPLANTKDDFWRMIWEQNSPMIVMVTQCVERGKSKCEEYWPTDREVHYYGDLAVRLKSESILTDYNLRIFELQLGSRTMEVKQMHFTMWPDFGCPENTSLLINFIRSVRAHMPHETTGPLVVHCSAGVGRTGTFLAVDKLMQHVQEHDYVDIYGTVREMRHFRTNMVQTEDQYIYIHECIKNLLIDSKNKSSTTLDSGEPEYETVSLVSHASTATSSEKATSSKANRLSEIDMTCLKSSNGTKRIPFRNTVI